ncbi:glycosyltransferase, group 2 family protein [Hoylesella oralis ATCC 33269]|uniref:Glycosyltransferase, group 2 family protein n=1 Tax=Hoylesella oralis ATCC 33269 TaxID=873533 RepID=E7RRM1_9BACT|nr:glycosyltransferase [Hoylesella oralis]EFZ36909.1 glycosyltransferase, group 2 family protein [Hoylesella oralis ATCC 33269]EPH18747.1 hypothetical protein HMPREF1475_00656 [Hoylesella oralis HGA0225]SHF76100.1 Glycosyltransferase involved in cell wall bisynthesis [Hoylesella oralis]
MRQLLLSIIIPVYNAEDYLRRCIDSVFKQGLNDNEFEVIIIDDGSQDKSYDIALAIVSEHENIFVCTQRNSGQAAARNVGLEKAKGKYVMFVDSDDYLFENTIKDIICLADRNNLDLCVSRVCVQKYDKTTVICSDFNKFSNKYVLSGEYVLLHNANPSTACAKLYLREFIKSERLSFYQGIVHEDVEFSYRVYALANRVMFTDIISYFYCWNDESTDHSDSLERKMKSVASDLQIAHNIKEFTKIRGLSKPLKKYFLYQSNSIVVGIFLSYLRKVNDLPSSFIIKSLYLAKELELYPIIGRTNSWKTTLCIPFLNREWLLRKMVYENTCRFNIYTKR